MVRYRVHEDRAEENAAFVRDVYEQLNREQPDGIRYATFVQEDGVSFVHVFLAESEEAAAALPRLEAFRRFQAGVRERCAEPPAQTPLREVGSYRLDPTGGLA
jgi:hypothetical protein